MTSSNWIFDNTYKYKKKKAKINLRNESLQEDRMKERENCNVYFKVS